MQSLSESTEMAERAADIMKAIAHPVRLRIVAILCGGNERVGHLAQRLGLRQSVVSQQLRILRMSGLVNIVKENGASKYAIAEPRLKEMVRCLEHCRQSQEKASAGA